MDIDPDSGSTPRRLILCQTISDRLQGWLLELEWMNPTLVGIIRRLPFGGCAHLKMGRLDHHENMWRIEEQIKAAAQLSPD